MKRRDLLRDLEKHGCEFLREGGNHTTASISANSGEHTRLACWFRRLAETIFFCRDSLSQRSRSFPVSETRNQKSEIGNRTSDIRHNLRVLEQKVNASDPPSPRLRRAKQTERSGQVRPATVHHPLLRITHHVQRPVQEQGRPVPNERPTQRSGQADRLSQLERTN
jgi:hypothetical protein